METVQYIIDLPNALNINEIIQQTLISLTREINGLGAEKNKPVCRPPRELSGVCGKAFDPRDATYG